MLCNILGRNLEDVDVSDDVKKILGVNIALHKPGKDADVTEKRQQALELIDHPERRGRNARQTMMMHKGGHGTGRTPDFPSRKEIEANM